MSVANGGFEVEGTTAGLADGWTSSFVATVEEYADFALNPTDASTSSQESFEAGWTGADDQSFVALFEGSTIDLEDAIYNIGPAQGPTETFEHGWPRALLLELGSMQVATFSGADAETFGTGWGTVIPTFADGTWSVAIFNPGARAATFDGFGTDWKGNESYCYAFADEFIEAAEFGAGAAPATSENFESVVEKLRIAVDATLNYAETITVPDPQLENGDLIWLVNEGGELPEPLSDDSPWYVINLDVGPPTTFKFTGQSFGGPTADLTTVGVGAHYMLRDPARYWTTAILDVT
jgi:hypothetical protein